MHSKQIRFSCLASAALAISGALLLASPTAFTAEPALTGDHITTSSGDLIIHPVNHATLVLGWKQLLIYVDPVGNPFPVHPDLVLITHIHQDHFSVPTLKSLATEKTLFIAPPSVADQLPAEWRSRTTVLTNGQNASVLGLKVEAVPAYNLTPDRQKFHPKGRDNGYILTLAGQRVYLSGDTEDTPEMRALKNIDVAFLCMNLPYTMDIEHAASAVRAFRPKIVYPYHSRGSDVEKFKKLVGEDAGVEVRLREWNQRGGQ